MTELLLTISADESDNHSVRIDGEGSESNFRFCCRALDDTFDPTVHLPAYFQEDAPKYRLLRECAGIAQSSRESITAQEIHRLGEWLYSLVILPNIQALTKLTNALNAATYERPAMVMIEIVPRGGGAEHAARRLRRVPWEMIYDPVNRATFGRHSKLICVRVSQAADAFHRTARPANQTLSTAYLGASPVGAGQPLDLDSEKSLLERAAAGYQSMIDLLPSNIDATTNDIRRMYLESHPRLLFMSFHGEATVGGERSRIACQNRTATNVEYADLIQLHDQLTLGDRERPIVTAINGCRCIDLAHDLADRGMIAIAPTGKIRNQVASFIFQRLLRELLWYNDIPRAVHRLRERLIDDLLKRNIDAELASWQSHFIACVMPRSAAHALLDHASVGRILVRSDMATTLNIRTIRMDKQFYGHDAFYHVSRSDENEILLRSGLYHVSGPGCNGHVLLNLEPRAQRSLRIFENELAHRVGA